MSDPENIQSEPQNTPSEGTPQKRRVRRATRYQRVQQRKAVQNASDQRFYNAMFAMMGFFALLVVLLGTIMLNGVPNGVSGMQGWTSPWIFGMSKFEIAGFAFVGLIAIAVGLRLKGKR